MNLLAAHALSVQSPDRADGVLSFIETDETVLGHDGHFHHAGSQGLEEIAKVCRGGAFGDMADIHREHIGSLGHG